MSESSSISADLKTKLEAAAREASKHAYCPYSNFPVGASVLTENDRIFAGCNVENAAYGSSMCAERNAIFQAVSKGARTIRALTVYTPTPHPTTPCGSCRQVLNEFGPDAEVFGVCDSTEITQHTLSELLPDSFGPKNLR